MTTPLPETHVKEFIDYVLACFPIAVSIAVAAISWLQFSINRSKLRLDLYQRRFHIYEVTLSFYQSIIEGKTDFQSEKFLDIQRDFIKSYRESQFLFDKKSKTHAILGEINDCAFVVSQFLVNHNHRTEDPCLYIAAHNEKDQALCDLNKLILELEKSIDSYLNFRRINAPFDFANLFCISR